MKPLKILIDGRMISKQIHGIGRYTKNLIEGLEERGQEVTVLGHTIDPKRKTILCRLPFAHPLESLELFLKTKDTNFDIYHFPSFAVPVKIKSNSVVTIHDLIHLHTGGKAHHVYYYTIVKRALTKCRGVIAISEWAKSEIHRFLEIPEDKITVVRNGLEKSFFKHESTGTTSPPHFLCLTNLKPHKNALTVIRAAQSLWKAGLQFNLDISLSGSDLPEEWAITPKEREKINVIKNVTDEEILSKLRNSRALISSSIYEGFNYPVAEALAQGKEVILSMGSAHDEFKSELVQFYGTPHDTPALARAMERALNQPPLAQFEKNVKDLSSMIDETLEVYRRVAYDFPL